MKSQRFSAPLVFLLHLFCVHVCYTLLAASYYKLEKRADRKKSSALFLIYTQTCYFIIIDYLGSEDDNMVTMTNKQFDALVSSFEYSAFKQYGQDGRRAELIPIIDEEMIRELWNAGMYDWQIASKLKINLYVLQSFLAKSGLDFTQRRSVNYKRIYFLSSPVVLFNGAAFFLQFLDQSSMTISMLIEAVSKFSCSVLPSHMQLIAEGRMMPNKQQLNDLITITGINKEAWCENSSDVNNILNNNIALPQRAIDFAITQDQFLSTYKKFPVHSTLLLARLIKDITPTQIVKLGIVNAHHELYDMEAGQLSISYDIATKLADLLGIDISDVYKVTVLNGGYYNIFRAEADKMRADCTKRIAHSSRNNDLLYRTLIDNITGLERSVLHAKRK